MAENVEPAPSTTHPAGATALLLVALALFVGGGLYSGWLFLANVSDLVAGRGGTPRAPTVNLQNVPVLQRVVGTEARSTTRPAATAVATTPTPAPEEPLPPWDGRDRVTILLLGIDQREDEKEIPTRSDTMILLTMDPLNLTAGMLSIPRDLWVPIPGYQPNKINVAHFLGENDKIGGGPAVAKRTISYNFGVPINYVARVDFQGFEQLINAIDGVTVDVDRAILDNEYPNEKYGISRLYIPPGPQHMDGRTALRYARSRHADSDFGRIRRQQRVLQAAREQTLTLGLIPKLPSMLGILRNSITTDVPWMDLIALANLGRRISSDAISSRQIDDTLIQDVNGDGSVLIPNRELIRPVVQELFYDPAVRQEGARIEVLNGTAREGLATTTKTALAAQGFSVSRADSADATTYRETVIVDNTGKKLTSQKLASLFKLPATAVRSSGRPTGTADITVILGSDFRGIS